MASAIISTKPTSRLPESEPLPPLVASLYGLLKDAQVDEEDYLRYLERKYPVAQPK